MKSQAECPARSRGLVRQASLSTFKTSCASNCQQLWPRCLSSRSRQHWASRIRSTPCRRVPRLCECRRTLTTQIADPLCQRPHGRSTCAVSTRHVHLACTRLTSRNLQISRRRPRQPRCDASAAAVKVGTNLDSQIARSSGILCLAHHFGRAVHPSSRTQRRAYDSSGSNDGDWLDWSMRVHADEVFACRPSRHSSFSTSSQPSKLEGSACHCSTALSTKCCSSPSPSLSLHNLRSSISRHFNPSSTRHRSRSETCQSCFSSLGAATARTSYADGTSVRL